MTASGRIQLKFPPFVHRNTRCGDSYVGNYTNALGHKPGSSATCAEYQVCTVCGKVLAEKLGHDYKSVVTAPVCEEQGYTTYTCVNCGDSYVDSYTDPIGHDHGDEATCTEDQVCIVCGKILAEKLGHDYKTVVTAPTCEEQGYTTYTCANCGDSYVDRYTNPLGHKPGSSVTCTEAQVCTVCGKVLTEMLGHNYKAVVTAPDCEHGGYTTYTCSRCGDSYVGNYTDPLGHKAGTAATCTKDQVCTVCGKVLAEKLGHNYKAVVTAPTCEEQGYTTYTCANCGDSYVDRYTNPLGHKPGSSATCTKAQVCTVCGKVLAKKLGHDYKAVVTAPTCEEQGYTTYTCANCGDSYIDTYTDPLGHKAGTAATCTKDQVCTVCGKVIKEKLGHNYRTVVTAPDCEEKGYTTHTCSRCGDSYIDTYTDPLGHKPGSSATCTKDQVCTVCGKVLAEKLGHNYKAVVTAPDCEEKGYTTHTCSRCGDSYVDSYTNPLGHKAGDWVVVKEPANVEDGLKAKQCTVCGKTLETEVVPGDAMFDVIVDMPEYYVYGDTLEAKITVENISDEKLSYVGFNICYDASRLKLLNDKNKDGSLNFVTATPEGWENLTAFDGCENGTVAVNLIITNYESFPEKDGDITLTLKFRVIGTSKDDISIYVPHASVKGSDWDNPSTLFAGNGSSDSSVYHEHSYTLEKCDSKQHKYVCACGDSYYEAHNFKNTVTAPTCEEKGYTTRTCKDCGEVVITDYTNALGHKPGDWVVVKEPANGENGLKEKNCTVCGKTVETEIIPGYVKGDVDGDGDVDAIDYGLAKRYCLGTTDLTEDMIKRGDLNGNGTLEASEYGLIKRHVLGTYTIV